MTEIKQQIKKEVENIKEQSNKSTTFTKQSKPISIKINSSSVMTAVLIILIIISIAQAMELGNLKEKISTGEVQAATTNSSNSSGGSTNSSNLQDLPSMVGGC